MKNIRKITGLVAAMALAVLLMTNCTKNEDSTIILLGEEQYIDEIINVIPDSLIGVFTQYVKIHKGYIPPNIQGEYAFTPKERVYTNATTPWPLEVVERDVMLKFSEQHNRKATFLHYEQIRTETDTVYVIGHDSYFSVYYQENVLLDYGLYEVKIKRGIIYSGRLMSDGIRNLFYASIIMDVDDESNGTGAYLTQPVGTFFIYKDGDGVAEKYDWYEDEE